MDFQEFRQEMSEKFIFDQKSLIGSQVYVVPSSKRLIS
jgi:hypothetical protein